jgi:hypothetical protein
MIRPASPYRIPVIVLAAALMALACSGCSGIRHDYPEKTTFRITARAAAQGDPKLKAGSPLLVRQLDISPEFESDAFVYRIGRNRFKTDYYHGFVVPPARMLTDIVAESLYATDRFLAAGTKSTPPTRYQLSGKIIDLYADLRNPSRYEALIAMRLTLDADTGKGFEPVVHHLYRETIPFDTLDPDLYIDGLNRGARPHPEPVSHGH